MRCSIAFFESPRQYAPATDSNSTAPIAPVESACPPRQRSVNSPIVYSVIGSPSGMPCASSTLYGLSRNFAIASSRVTRSPVIG